jgi:hypothetical protein
MKKDLEMFFIILCFVAFNVCGLVYNKNRFDEIKYQQRVEGLGTFLITKFNENEKSCPGVIMANGQRVFVGAVAISPDIRDSGLLMFGDKIRIDGYGDFEVACITHKRLKRTIDIYEKDIKKVNEGAKRRRVWLKR